MTGDMGIWISLGALAVAAVLSTMSRALVRATRTGVDQIVNRRNDPKCAACLAKIMGEEEHHVAALALPRLTLDLIAVVGLVAWVSALRSTPSPDILDAMIGVVVGAIGIWVTGVVIPLAVAEHAAERTVVAWSPVIRAIGIVLAPLHPSMRFVMEVVRRLTGEEKPTAAQSLEAELMSVVEEGEREGRIDEAEREMIEAVVEFRSTTVEQIMTPRTEMKALAYTDDLFVLKAFTKDAGHSRVPVYEENLDHIVGILYMKDLLRWIVEHGSENDERFTLRDVVRPATFVPETKTVRELLTDLLAAKVHIAIIADEYGGTSGLVTIEDIIEEIVGEIQDEYEPEEEGESPVVVDLEARRADIDARTEIDDANDELDVLGIELPENNDYDTVGGFVVVQMGRIPEVGDRFEHGRLIVTVLEAEPTRVARVRIEVASQDDAAKEPAPQSSSEQPAK